MATRRTREETRALNDEALLEAGRRVFLERGFHGASLDQVSAAAGLTKGAVYARYASKGELFLALLDAHVTERIAESRAVVARARSLEQAARAVAQQWMARSATHGDWALLVLEFRIVAARDPALLAPYRAVHARLRAAVAALASELSERSGEPLAIPAATWARLSLGIGNGLALERIAGPSDDDSRDYEHLLVALARGVAFDPEGA